ncbi:hypothetical protein RTBOTA2_002764 [Rhodotorula toruloides]|nr:hypothetical protein RTBOTA2_002764 [Rhodotorula toruloides]
MLRLTLDSYGHGEPPSSAHMLSLEYHDELRDPPTA